MTGLLAMSGPVGVGSQGTGVDVLGGRKGHCSLLSFPDLCSYRLTLPPAVCDLAS